MAQFTHSFDQHPDTGWHIVRLSCIEADSSEPQAVAQFSPDVGSNLFSLQVGGTEYLVGMIEHQGKPMILGSPILYPSPNRVRNAQFTFDGRTFKFEPNDGTNFLHGLVQREPWVCDRPIATTDGVSVTTRITFEPNKTIYDLFPIRNTLELTYTLKSDGIRFDFQVRNEDMQHRLPFGLGIHPFFRVIGPRDSIRLQVPAKKWMEAVDLLPTGRLLDLEDSPADIRYPTPLSEINLDDVFWGMEPDEPQVIYYDSIGKRVTLAASDFFTHTCVFARPQYPFFCVENQSCSTDAHNLFAQGLEKEAHLAILEPGESLSAWIEITVSDQ